MNLINSRKMERIKTTVTLHEYVATDYALEAPVFESRHRQGFSLHQKILTGSDAHPASYSMGNGAFIWG